MRWFPRPRGDRPDQAGAGRGAHCAINEAQAPTSSSEKRPSRYLPRRTSPPQPASPQMQSVFPDSARSSRKMRPRRLYSGIPPGGHCPRGSIGRLVRRRVATQRASARFRRQQSASIEARKTSTSTRGRTTACLAPNTQVFPSNSTVYDSYTHLRNRGACNGQGPVDYPG